ncbi:MAG: PIN domain-containing protein [Chloroflexota bacterium]|nr:PIN domain-containing protein [Chloroflexota bacterium]
MAKPQILLDTSYLHALIDADDKYHERARAFAANTQFDLLLVDVAITEITYSLRTAIGKHAELAFIKSQSISPIPLVAITTEDLGRVHAIMSKYLQFDFVDCCILAVAERLNVTHVCTFDRRDFTSFKPVHCDYLELLP